MGFVPLLPILCIALLWTVDYVSIESLNKSSRTVASPPPRKHMIHDNDLNMDISTYLTHEDFKTLPHSTSTKILHTEVLKRILGYDVIDRGEGDAPGFSIALVSSFPIKGNIYQLQFYAYQTEGILRIGLLRQLKGDAVWELTPIFVEQFKSGTYTIGKNEVSVDWACEAGDTIGISWDGAGVVSKNEHDKQNYWVRHSADLIVGMKYAYKIYWGNRQYSYRALYYASKNDGTM